MKLVSEATKEELKAALAALDDPYREFKEALEAGKRVRCAGFAWRTKYDTPFCWNAPLNQYEIEQEPEPQLYCGYSEEQWQFVVDGGFDVKLGDESLDFTKYEKNIHNIRDFDRVGGTYFCSEDIESFSYCHIVRRKNHPQPAFGRSTERSDMMLVCYEDDSHDILQESSVEWHIVKWFINLSRDG